MFGIDVENAAYPYSQQKRDFLLLEFKYAYRLKQRLNDGTITQDYYDSHIELAHQQLDSPYAGWWDEFTTAIDSKDLTWIANQVGKSVEEVANYIGTTAGQVVGGILQGVGSGIASGFSSSIGFAGIVVVLVIGIILWIVVFHSLPVKTS